MELNLSNNGISDISSDIWNLTNLNNLDLSYNQLSHIPATIGNLNLSDYVGLNLSNNQLMDLPPEITNLSEHSVHILDLSNNWLLWSSASLYTDSSSEICNIIWSNWENICISWNGMSVQISSTSQTPQCASNPWYSNTIYTEWSPIQVYQPWQNSSSWEACYYECESGYTWYDCSEITSCETSPWYEHAIFIDWTPTEVNQSRQNYNSWEACYYECESGYSWDYCENQ
jgi:hypothetical protein